VASNKGGGGGPKKKNKIKRGVLRGGDKTGKSKKNQLRLAGRTTKAANNSQKTPYQVEEGCRLADNEEIGGKQLRQDSNLGKWSFQKRKILKTRLFEPEKKKPRMDHRKTKRPRVKTGGRDKKKKRGTRKIPRGMPHYLG